MPETYTKEQIDEAKEWFSSFTKQKHHGLHEKYGAILLSALDTAERERDENERKGKDLCTWVGNLMIERDRLRNDLAERDALKARAAELIKVGNSVIHIQEKRGDGEYDGYSRYLRAVKKWDALTTQVEK